MNSNAQDSFDSFLRLLDTNDIEDKLITIALARADGNRTKAAKLLNMPVRSFRRKISERIKKDE